MRPESKTNLPEVGMRTESDVPIEKIDSGEETFRITTCPCTDDLTASIRSCGLINLPILRDRGSTFGIISGFRRVEACRQIGFSRIPARVVSRDLDESHCIRLAVTDNALQRPLNPLEASRIVTLFSRIHPDHAALAEASTLAGFPLHPAMVEKLITLGRLPHPVQEAVAEGFITLPVAMDLADLDPKGAVALTTLFDRLKLGFSQQRETILWATEVAGREDLSIADLLKEPALEEILNDSQSDRVQKSLGVRSYLKKRRFPYLVGREEAFKKCIKKLKLGADVFLLHPRDFEGPAYSLTLQFNTLEALSARKTTVDRILNDPDFKKFLEQ